MKLKTIVIYLKLGNPKIIMPKEREPQILGKKKIDLNCVFAPFCFLSPSKQTIF